MIDDLELNVRRKLREIEPSLNNDKDARVFGMITEDFSEYLIWKRIESFEEAELGFWVSLWLSSYRKRVKLILNAEENKRAERIERSLRKNKTALDLDPEEKEDLENLAIFTLLRKGELCCLRILARELVKRLQFEISDLKAKNRTELILTSAFILINNCRSLASTSGFLIFINVGKAYFL